MYTQAPAGESLAPVHGCINQTHLHAMHNTRERREGKPWRFQKSRRGSHPVRPVRLDALNRCLLPRQDVRTLDRRAKSSRCRFALLWPAATSAPVAPTKNQPLQCLPSHKKSAATVPASKNHPSERAVESFLLNCLFSTSTRVRSCHPAVLVQIRIYLFLSK